MRLLKSHSLLRLVNSYVIDSPQPANISYLFYKNILLILNYNIIFLFYFYIPLNTITKIK